MTREYFQNAAEDWGAEKLAITRCNLQFDEIAHYGK
jgi:hypothetical protein